MLESFLELCNNKINNNYKNKELLMALFEHVEFDQHEKVSFFHDKETGLKAIVSIHNTNLGPALGGCRMWDYASEEEAINDVLRLSRGMTYKAAVAGLPLGGGKSVVIGDAKSTKTPDLMRALGRAVNSLGGRYIVAEDVGVCVDDMVEVSKETDHVVGLPTTGESVGGDPSPLTAYGVFVGLKTTAERRLGISDLKGVKVAVQGLGNVGYNLCKFLAEAGAELYITDVQADKIQQGVDELGATAVALNEIYSQDVDIFSPCALGAIINDDTIKQLKAKVIAGAANNQLAQARHGDVLAGLNILYAPDYVINAGGLINVYYEQQAKIGSGNYSKDEVRKHIESIQDTLNDIYTLSEQDKIATSLAADRLAESRFLKKNDILADQAA